MFSHCSWGVWPEPIYQDVNADDSEDYEDLPDRERIISGDGDQPGDLTGVPDAGHPERLVRDGAVPDAGAAGGAAAVIRPDAAAHGSADDAVCVPGVCAEPAASERQQPGRRAVPAAEHSGGECSFVYLLGTMKLNNTIVLNLILDSQTT